MTKKIVKKGYKPTETEEFMNKSMVEYFRDKLQSSKEKLLSRDDNKILNTDLQSLKEPDMNDRATMEEEASLDLKNKERIGKSLQDIELALNKIKSGDYGYCEKTGEPISVERLDAIPTTIYTVEALEALEKAKGNRPL